MSVYSAREKIYFQQCINQAIINTLFSPYTVIGWLAGLRQKIGRLGARQQAKWRLGIHAFCFDFNTFNPYIQKMYVRFFHNKESEKAFASFYYCLFQMLSYFCVTFGMFYKSSKILYVLATFQSQSVFVVYFFSVLHLRIQTYSNRKKSLFSKFYQN